MERVEGELYEVMEQLQDIQAENDQLKENQRKSQEERGELVKHAQQEKDEILKQGEEYKNEAQNEIKLLKVRLVCVVNYIDDYSYFNEIHS